MSDWREHNGGPQPVADDVWVDRLDGAFGLAGFLEWNWSKSTSFRILNQHLIDAARLEGIRLGLEAAADALQAHDTRPGAWTLIVQAIRNLNPETIAKEADNEPR